MLTLFPLAWPSSSSSSSSSNIQQVQRLEYVFEWLAVELFYVHLLNMHSQRWRGEEKEIYILNGTYTLPSPTAALLPCCGWLCSYLVASRTLFIVSACVICLFALRSPSQNTGMECARVSVLCHCLVRLWYWSMSLIRVQVFICLIYVRE